MMRVEFTVAGLPVPQGSTRAFVVNSGGKPRAVVVHDNKATLQNWREAIATEARAALQRGEMIDGGVRVVVTFRLPRPRGHFGARGLKSSSPAFPVTLPDLDKLARSCLDALTSVAFRDDSQVVSLHVRKVYSDSPTAQPGADIAISEMAE